MNTSGSSTAPTIQSQQLRLGRFTLAFPTRDLRDEYNAQFWLSSREVVRFSLLLATALYLLFGFLDRRIIPEVADRFMVIRVIVALFLLGVFAFSFRPTFRRYFQGAMILSVFATGGGVLAMIAASDQMGGYRYYAGLMLVVMFGQSMLRLRFVHATGATFVIILAYELLDIFVVGAPADIVLNNTFFLVSANILGMFTSYGIEFYLKTVFWQRRQLRDKQRALNVEHKRKTGELQAARDLQLAMLPRCLPDHPTMDICVSMTTATEVGGDYYDFVEADDGTLTFAVADAAGHGARAGAIVAAMKGMFSNHGGEDDIADFLRRMSRHLRGMRIPNMFMAAVAGRVRGHTLEVAGAGLPPAVIYREATGELEHCSLKGVPLGTYADVEYSKSSITLSPGDLVVFMTDGFLELFNPEGEMLGMERADAMIREAAASSPTEVICKLQDAARAWAGNGSQNDDITFLVIKGKHTS